MTVEAIANVCAQLSLTSPRNVTERENSLNGDISALGFYRYRCGTQTPVEEPDNGNTNNNEDDEKDKVDPDGSLDPNSSRDNN